MKVYNENSKGSARVAAVKTCASSTVACSGGSRVCMKLNYMRLHFADAA